MPDGLVVRSWSQALSLISSDADTLVKKSVILLQYKLLDRINGVPAPDSTSMPIELPLMKLPVISGLAAETRMPVELPLIVFAVIRALPAPDARLMPIPPGRLDTVLPIICGVPPRT